jgi:hypothetical protein
MPAGRRRGLGAAQYQALLRADFTSFATHVFAELYPRARFQMNWHLWVIAARLSAVRAGSLHRLAIHLPPRHLKSLLASVAFPAWVLGHEPEAPIPALSVFASMLFSPETRGTKLVSDIQPACRAIRGFDSPYLNEPPGLQLTRDTGRYH